MAFSVAPISRTNRLTPQSLLSRTPSIRPGTFQTLMDRLCTSAAGPSKATAAAYTVRQGDTLSAICRRAISGSGRTPSAQDVAQAVVLVARTNGIANPDRIQAGQTLNLNPIQGEVSASGGPHTLASPSLALTRLLQSIASTATPAKGSTTTGRTSLDDLLDGPLEVTSGFGLRKDPFSGGSDYHTGIDFAAETGTGIHAWKSGVVKFSGWQPDYGRIVVVAHADDTETAYAHNSKNLVKAGQFVSADTRIALVGSTGRSTGPHLHFEVRRGGKAVDPDPFTRTESFQVAKAL